jgi:hypothetical protein
VRAPPHAGRARLAADLRVDDGRRFRFFWLGKVHKANWFAFVWAELAVPDDLAHEVIE